jgi:exodeoxyribonuclease VII large subunit
MSPESILKKGFAIVKYKGQIISNPNIFESGVEMEIILMSKSIKSTVKSKSQYNGNEFNL